MLTRYSSARTFIMTSTALAVVALCGGLAHALGWVPFERVDTEPRTYVSSVVELFCGMLLLGAAFSLGHMRPNAWRSALGAHLIALSCLTLGTVLLSAATRVSYWSQGFHGFLFVLITLNLAGLWRLRPRNPLRRAQHEIAARLY